MRMSIGFRYGISILTVLVLVQSVSAVPESGWIFDNVGKKIWSLIDGYDCADSYCVYHPWYVPTQTYAKNGSTQGIDYSGTDSASVIRDVINSVVASGGGTVFLKSGNYNLSITLPQVDFATEQLVGLTLKGEYIPHARYDLVGLGVDPILPTSGTVISNTTGEIISSNGNGLRWTKTGIFLKLEDITFSTIDNPSFNALNLSHVISVDMNNVVVDTGTYGDSQTFPTTLGSTGIVLPYINAGMTTLQNVFVSGYGVGIRMNEQAVLNNIWILKNRVGYQVDAMNQDSLIIRTVVVDTPYIFNFTGTSYLTVLDLNREYVTSGDWMANSTNGEIYDPNNQGRGSINWHSILANSGANNTLYINGARKIRFTHWGNDVIKLSNGMLGNVPWGSLVPVIGGWRQNTDTSQTDFDAELTLAGASGYINNGNTVDDLDEIKVPSLALNAGTYNITIGYAKSSNSGIFQLLHGSTSIGTQDFYSAATAYNNVVTFSYTITTRVQQDLRFRVNGKNASSSDYAVNIARIEIRKVS